MRNLWEVSYFKGGYLMKSNRMSKVQAKTFMMEHIDGHYMEQVTGSTKGKRIFKYPENCIKLSEKDYEEFVKILNNPAKTSQALKKLFGGNRNE